MLYTYPAVEGKAVVRDMVAAVAAATVAVVQVAAESAEEEDSLHKHWQVNDHALA